MGNTKIPCRFWFARYFVLLWVFSVAGKLTFKYSFLYARPNRIHLGELLAKWLVPFCEGFSGARQLPFNYDCTKSSLSLRIRFRSR